MDDSEIPTGNENRLSREVLVPAAPTQGLGVILIAATAMLFAVTGSALMVRARTQAPRCGAHQPEVQARPSLVDQGQSCGIPEYRTNPDGTASVVFQVCPGDVRTIRLEESELSDQLEALLDGTADGQERIEGVEVGRVDR